MPGEIVGRGQRRHHRLRTGWPIAGTMPACSAYRGLCTRSLAGRFDTSRRGTLETVLSSDVVSLYAELTDRQPWPSRHLIGASQLQEMNEDALSIDASRGAFVDNGALLSVLESGRGPETILDVREGTTDTAQAFDPLRKDCRVCCEFAGSSVAADELDVEPCELQSALGCDLRDSNT